MQQGVRLTITSPDVDHIEKAIYEELAYETVRLEISIGDNPYKGNDIPMMVAKRDQVSDIIAL